MTNKDIIINVPSFVKTNSKRKKKSNNRLCSLPFLIILITVFIMIITTLTMNHMTLYESTGTTTKKWIEQWNQIKKVAYDTLYVYDTFPTLEPIINPPINWSIDYDDEFDDINNQKKEIVSNINNEKNNIDNNDNKKNERLSERNDYHEIAASHPQYSPRDGTEYNNDNQFIILGCIHQSKCIGIKLLILSIIINIIIIIIKIF